VLIIASILFHELAHAFAGRYYRLHTSHIELHAFGGFAMVHGHAGDRGMMMISAAGPISNLLLWLVFNGIAQVAGFGVIGWVALGVAHTNLMLGLFNLLPAYPLDGGSILLHWLCMRAPEAQARWLAFTIGRWISAPLGILGLLGGNLLMSLIFYTAYVTSTAMLEAVGHVNGWPYWKARWTGRGGSSELKIDWQKFSPGRKKTFGERIRGWFTRRPNLRVTPRSTESVEDPDEPRPPTIN
jgi:Zn-dependent protease